MQAIRELCRRGLSMRADVRQLVGLVFLACSCVALAWSHDNIYFLVLFAVLAIVAAAEAVRRTL